MPNLKFIGKFTKSYSLGFAFKNCVGIMSNIQFLHATPSETRMKMFIIAKLKINYTSVHFYTITNIRFHKKHFILKKSYTFRVATHSTIMLLSSQK